MHYKDLCEYYQKLEATTKRLEKTDILIELLKKVNKEELKDVVYLVQGRVFPDWDERKLGFSSQLMIKAISGVVGASKNDLIKQWKKTGDLGSVAEHFTKTKKQNTLRSEKLTIKKVFDNIQKLASLEGKGTVNKKIQLVAELLSNADSVESRFITRTVLEDLRVGVAQGILRDSIAKAFNFNVDDIENAFDKIVDYGEVAVLAKEDKLKQIKLVVGRPVRLMLAVPVKNVDEAFEALGRPADFEFKLDGFRSQIHKKDNKFTLYSRNFEDVTKQFPDVIEYVTKYVDGKNFIIDSEVVAINRKNGKYLPFQTISQRIKRKYDIEKLAKEFPIELNIFDIVYYEGKNLFDEKLIDRRKILEKIVKEVKGKIVLTKKLITDDNKKANEFFHKALEAGTEGLMIKNINCGYVPGRYVNGWVKLKSILEPLDLVILEAEYGNGKRANLLTSYTIACRKDDSLVEIGKVSTGVKEKAEGLTYNEMTKMLKKLIVSEHGKTVKVKPQIIIEVGYEEIQKSPSYSSGFALRFPRFIKLKTDKGLNDINTIKDVERIYKMQRK